MKIIPEDVFFLKDRGQVICFSLNKNNFKLDYNIKELLNLEIEVNDIKYLIKEVEKFKTAAPIAWEQERSIAVLVEALNEKTGL